MTSRTISQYFHVLSSPRSGTKRSLLSSSYSTPASTTRTRTPSSSSMAVRHYQSHHPQVAITHPDLSVISEILPGQLYLSGYEVVTPENLRSRGITAVVCAMTTWEAHRTQMNGPVIASVKMCRVPVTDSETTDISVYFDETTRFINDELKRGGRVLVHCVAGISRSVSIVLAYLVNRGGYQLLDAFHLVAGRRSIAWPNDGFYRQLIKYEKSLRDTNKSNNKKSSSTSNRISSGTSSDSGYQYRTLPSLRTSSGIYRNTPRSPGSGRSAFLV